MLPPSAEAGHVVFARRKFPSANISNRKHSLLTMMMIVMRLTMMVVVMDICKDDVLTENWLLLQA